MEEFNKCQSSLEELQLQNYPKEIQEQFFDYLNNVPFIKWMVSKDRPLVSELPRDGEGKVKIDVAKPPILENVEYFRQPALAYKKQGFYTALRPNKNPNSEFGKWIREERRRSWDGYIDPKTGMWVTGDMYFLMNYCPIHQVKKGKNGMTQRIVDFSKFWDGQFFVTHYLQQAREEGHHAAELASRGKGKAHPYSQIVYTPEGAKQWGDVKVGDFLFGDDGVLTKVTMIPFDEEENIYTVSLSDGRTLQATSGHLFKVKDNRKKPQVRIVSLQEIMDSDYAHKRKDGGIEYYYAIPNNKKVEFNPQDILIDPYTLGLLLGDGCLTRSSLNVAEFTTNEEDLKTYRKYVPYEIYCKKAKYSHGIRINNFGNYLKEYDLIDATSDKKFIPKNYMYNTSNIRMQVLQGLMDTDGTVNNNGVPMITTVSKKLAEDIRWLCHSLGYNSTMFTKQGKYKDSKGTHICKLNYNITILTNDPIFRLPRKLKRLTNFESAYSRSRKDWTRIVDIKYSHKEKAKCVIVDNESHCYLIGDFIVTHNTSLGAAMLAKRFILGENEDNTEQVQSWATATDRTKLLGENQILSVFIDNIDFCSKNTEFPRARLQSSRQEMIWRMGYKKSDGKVEYGSRNTVQGIITGVNQDKLNGSRGVLYLIEEAGIFKDLLSMYNLIRPSVEQGNDVFGLLFEYGTAGDEESDFQDFQEMFYGSEGYNIKALENIFDKEGQGRQKCGMFYPAYLNRDDTCMDENGNSNVTKALLELLVDRYKVKYNTTDVTALTKRVSQYPITPQEAILRSNKTIFPITELNERLNQIDNNPSEYDDVYIGELVQGNQGIIEFRPTGDIPIREYPLKDNKLQGALEIYCMPQKDANGKVPQDRYILSSDPYNSDGADTLSLGSILVLDLWTDTLVAEYTGRQQYTDDYFEICRKLCLFYNGKLMYENNLKGTFAYFNQHNCLYLLADTPEYLRDKQIIKTIGYGNNSKGITATAGVKNYGYGLIRDWLVKPTKRIEKDAEGNEQEVTIANLYNIRNRALLKELIIWTPERNVDRICSLIQLMLYREEKMILYQGDLSKSSRSQDNKKLEDDDYFTRNYKKKEKLKMKN